MASQPLTEGSLDGPETYHAWYAMINATIPRDLWKYVDPETENEFEEPEEITFDSVRPGATTLRELTAAEKTQYANLRNVYKNDITQYQRYLSEEAKLRTKILSTIAEAKRSMLRAETSVRTWISNLQTATKPTNAQMKTIVRARHRILLGTKYIEWPTGGPEKWTTEWQRLMTDCERWCPAIYEDWAGDFNLVWGEVPEARRICDRLVEALTDGGIQEWDTFRATRELRQAWDQKSIRSGMKVGGKGRITRAAFAAQPRFDGSNSEEQQELINPEPSTTTLTVDRTRSRSTSRKRLGTDTTQQEGFHRGQKKTQTCWGCAGPHIDFKCPLITNYNPTKMRIPNDWQETFDRKMSDRAFERKVNVIRDANKIRKELAMDTELRTGKE
jgi:hypothetical protein